MTDKQVLIEMFERNEITFELNEETNVITSEPGYAVASQFQFNSDDSLQSVKAYEF